MNNPLNATDPLGLYCYFGDGATIGVSGPRNPGLECGTGALDACDPGDPDDSPYEAWIKPNPPKKATPFDQSELM